LYFDTFLPGQGFVHGVGVGEPVVRAGMHADDETAAAHDGPTGAAEHGLAGETQRAAELQPAAAQ
jgi:hypothetical protein